MNEPDKAVVADQDGMMEMAIGNENKKVIQVFQRPMQLVRYEPQNAVGIAKSMIDHATLCGLDVRIELPRRQVTDTMRDHLIARVALVVGQLVERKRSPGQVALEIVDICLRDLT